MTGRLARNTIKTFATLTLRIFVQAATLLSTVRLLGNSNYGVYAGCAGMAVAMSSLSTFGSHLVLLARASRNEMRPAIIWSYAWPMTLAVGSLLFACYLALIPMLGATTSQMIPLSVALGIGELILMPLTTLLGAAAQSTEHVAFGQVAMLAPYAGRLIAVGLCLLFPALHNLRGFAAAYVVGTFSGCAVCFSMTVRYVADAGPPRAATRKDWREGANYALMNFAALNPTELDKALVLRFAGPHVSGIYAASTRVIAALVTPVVAMMLSAQPRLFRQAAQDHYQAKRLTILLLAVATTYGCVVAAILVLAAHGVALLFGQEFLALGEMLVQLAALPPLMALRITCGSILMTAGKPLARAAFEIFGLVTLVAAITYLARPGSLHGLALAVCIAEGLMAVTGIVMVSALLRRNT